MFLFFTLLHVVGLTIPLKNHKKFNVGRYMKIRIEEQDCVLKENAKLLNCIENEERKLKTQRMKISRLQSKVSLMFIFRYGQQQKPEILCGFNNNFQSRIILPTSS